MKKKKIILIFKDILASDDSNTHTRLIILQLCYSSTYRIKEEEVTNIPSKFILFLCFYFYYSCFVKCLYITLPSQHIFYTHSHNFYLNIFCAFAYLFIMFDCMPLLFLNYIIFLIIVWINGRKRTCCNLSLHMCVHSMCYVLTRWPIHSIWIQMNRMS